MSYERDNLIVLHHRSASEETKMFEPDATKRISISSDCVHQELDLESLLPPYQH